MTYSARGAQTNQFSFARNARLCRPCASAASTTTSSVAQISTGDRREGRQLTAQGKDCLAPLRRRLQPHSDAASADERAGMDEEEQRDGDLGVAPRTIESYFLRWLREPERKRRGHIGNGRNCTTYRMFSPLETLNRDLFLRINGDSPSLAATVVADDVIYAIPLLLFGLWLWGDQVKRSLALKACLVVGAGLLANLVIGIAWPHPRPFMIGLGHTWIPHAPDSSFPSDHATVFAGVGVTLLLGGEIGLGFAVLLTGLCVGWARVFLGVHFPLDIAGAFCVAALSWAASTPLWNQAGGSITGFAERTYRRSLRPVILAGWLRR